MYVKPLEISWNVKAKAQIYDVLEYITKVTINDPEFDVDQWSEYDAFRLIRAGEFIKNKLEEKKSNAG